MLDFFYLSRAEFRGSNQYFVVGWAQGTFTNHGLMTSCHFLGWNPWEWICVKRESFFDWSLGLGQTWCGKFFCFWFDQSESSFAEMPFTGQLANQRRRRSVRTRTIAPSPVILTNWLCQFSKLKINLGVFPQNSTYDLWEISKFIFDTHLEHVWESLLNASNPL